MQKEKEYIVGRDMRALRLESTGEYSLPDYNGDVKRVLAVKTRLTPAGSFVGEDTLDISGTVAYDVVYVDADDIISHAEFSTDYDASVRISPDVYVDSDVRARVVGCNMRLVGPRKLLVKCSLDADVSISEKRGYYVGGDAFIEYEPELVTATAEVYAPSFIRGEAREMSEEITSLDGVISDEIEVLLSDAIFILDSLVEGEESVEIKGSIKASILYRSGEDVPRLMTKAMPYTAVVSLPDAELSDTEPHVSIGNVRAVVQPTDDGVSLALTLTVTPSLISRSNRTLELVSDAYLKERGSENEYIELGYTEHVASERCESTLSSEVPLSEVGIESGGEVVWADATAKVDGCEVVDGGVRVEGEIRFAGIVCQTNDDMAPICHPIKFNIPFNENVNINCQNHSNLRAECNVCAIEPEIKIGESILTASCTVVMSATVMTEKRQRCLGSSYLTDEEYVKDASVVTVYYPDPSESLFDIAKRFHTSVGAIAVSNRLAESVSSYSDRPLGTSGVNKLIIK